jgi:hypothetical protein
MRGVVLGLLVCLVPPPLAAFTLGARAEFTHPGKGHEAHVSAPAVAIGADGVPLVAWIAQEGHDNNLYAVRLTKGEPVRVRVNPEGTSVDSMHQAPGIAAGPGGEVYLSWASHKPKPEGTLFASDLRLSRSLDGGRRFDHHVVLNDDRPISHSFEGLTVMPEGTVLVAWIDSRDGPQAPRTFVARVGDRGTRVLGTVKLDDTETCVCCRIDVATGPDVVAVLWRKVWPGDIRDMVLGLSADGGRTFAPPVPVHADGWKITACPHRGGQVAVDGRGRISAVWYTEGRDDAPRVLFATAPKGGRFGAPSRLDRSAGAIPDHVRLAADGQAQLAVVWEESTAVRRRVLLRGSRDGGRTFDPVRVVSRAIKAYAPGVTAGRSGEFVLAWHEEQFPHTKTVVQHVRLSEARSRE